MPRKRKLFSDQLRRLIDECGLSRYRIAKESGVDAGQLSRFMHGTGELTTATLDRLTEVMALRLESDLEEE